MLNRMATSRDDQVFMWEETGRIAMIFPDTGRTKLTIVCHKRT